MDNKVVVYGHEPSDVLKSLRLSISDDHIVDRLLTEKGDYLLKVTEYSKDTTFINYIYFRDITSMFCTIDVLTRKSF